MYEEFYGLVRPPFEMTPDPSFLYLGDTHREGLAMLHYALRSRKGFIALTGEVGTGKTTLVHSLLSQLESGMPSAFLFNPRLEPLDFLRILFDEFGIDAECRTKAEYLMALNHFLIDCLSRDRVALLIIDEAQNLSPEMLEEVRLLSNLETPSSKLLQIMLVGQPELDEMLDRPQLRQLRQRIVLRHQLRPFGREDVDHYVEERLRLAGYTGKGIFDRAARKALHEVTGGVPRVINVVCDSALLLGYSREEPVVDEGIIREVVSELRLVPEGPASRSDQEQRGRGRNGSRTGSRSERPEQPAEASMSGSAAPATPGLVKEDATRPPERRRERRFNWFGLFD